MNHAALALIVLAGGFAGGLTGSLLLLPETAAENDRSEPASEAWDEPRAAVAPRRVQALEAKFGELQAEISFLRAELQQRESLASLDAGAHEASRSGETAPGLALSEGPADWGPNLDARITAVLDTRAEAARQEREAKQAEQREERFERQLNQLQERLQLDDYQRGEVGRILRETDAARIAFMNQVRDNKEQYDRDSIRNGIDEVRRSTETQLQSVLTTEQFESYQQQNARTPRDKTSGRQRRRPNRDQG